MKIAIIDDDRFFAKELQDRITALCNKNGCETTLKCFGQPDLILTENEFSKYDIIFLDIEMPEINGINLAKNINMLKKGNLLPYVVFVTSQDHLVFEALKQFPYSFIRKANLEDIDACINNLSKRLIASPTYSIKDGRGIHTIEVKNIIRLDKQRNYTVFYTKDGMYQERSTIDEKYDDLSEHHFLRPHIGALINAEHIKECKNDIVLMSDGSMITISRSYKKTFKTDLHKWIKG